MIDVEVIETEKEVKVVAELPGMEQNDIDLSLQGREEVGEQRRSLQ